jgi:hypothetical protein
MIFDLSVQPLTVLLGGFGKIQQKLTIRFV